MMHKLRTEMCRIWIKLKLGAKDSNKHWLKTEVVLEAIKSHEVCKNFLREDPQTHCIAIMI